MWISNTNVWHCRESNHWMSEWNVFYQYFAMSVKLSFTRRAHILISVSNPMKRFSKNYPWVIWRLWVLAWLCRKEIATAFVYVWLMKGIFTLNPSPAKCFFLPFTYPWQGLFNPSVGFAIPKKGSIFPITGFSFPKWSSFNTRRDLSFPLSPYGSKWRS